MNPIVPLLHIPGAPLRSTVSVTGGTQECWQCSQEGLQLSAHDDIASTAEQLRQINGEAGGVTGGWNGMENE